MWGWLSDIFSGLESIWQSVSNIPSLIWSFFEQSFNDIFSFFDWFYEEWLLFFDNIFGALYDIWSTIADIPGYIIEGISEIFIPNTEDIEDIFNSALDSIQSKFGFQEFNFNAITSNSAQPTDIKESYYIYGLGNMNLTFFNTKYLIQGVEFFRPFIRGFIVLLLVFYNIRQYLSFIGHDLGAVAYAEKSSKGD